MKAVLKFVALIVLVFAGAGSALAYGYGYYGHHGHRHSSVGVGFVFGGPVWSPWYYPPPAYYPYPVYERVVPPVVYVEQPAPSAEAAGNYWYYCRSASAYYPYVKECPAGWERVAPQPGQR